MRAVTGIQKIRRRLVHGILARWRGGRPIAAVAVPAKGIHRIVVLRPNHRLGNTLLLTPLVVEIGRLFPGAEIDVLCAGTAAHDVFAAHGNVRNLWTLPNRVVRHPFASWRTLRRMRKTHYDLAIDPCVGSQSARLLLGYANARHKLGFSQPGIGGGLTCGVAVPVQHEHMGQLPVYLLRNACAQDFGAFPCPGLDLCLSDQELRAGRERLHRLSDDIDKAAGPCIALFGDATGNKRLSEDWWTSMIANLRQLRPASRFVEIVPASGRSRFGDAYPAYYSTSIRSMAGIMAAADLVISADCGVMHLAAAAGACTIGIFKTTRPLQYGPYGANNLALCAGGRPASEVADAVDRFLDACPRDAWMHSPSPDPVAPGSPASAHDPGPRRAASTNRLPGLATMQPPAAPWAHAGRITPT